jgi:hypothetical protein
VRSALHSNSITAGLIPANAIPVRGEEGLGVYTAEALRSRRSSYKDIILNKPSANSASLW